MAVLSMLNRLGYQIKNLREKLEFHQELAACEQWTAAQLAAHLKLRPGGEAKVESILIDRQVNQMDPDFSFSGEMWGEPMPSLCNRERPN